MRTLYFRPVSVYLSFFPRLISVDKQQQLEGMCAELEAANAKGNSRKVFETVKSMTRKFQPRLQCIQSAMGDSLTEAAQIADRWKGYCENFSTMRKGTEQEYWEQKPAPLRSKVARAIRQTATTNNSDLIYVRPKANI